MEANTYPSELIYPSWVEEAAERLKRIKAIHIGGLLVREASTSGRLGHMGHYIPIWIDPPFPPFPDGPIPLTREGEAIEAWLSVHKPVPLVRLKKQWRKLSVPFPVLVPIAKGAQEHEGAEDRQERYKATLKTAHGASGGPRRTWLDKLVIPRHGEDRDKW